MNVKCIHHFLISGKVLYVFDHSSDALSWYLAEIMDREVGDLLFFCFCHNGAAKWMLRKFFQRGGYLQKSCLWYVRFRRRDP